MRAALSARTRRLLRSTPLRAVPPLLVLSFALTLPALAQAPHASGGPTMDDLTATHQDANTDRIVGGVDATPGKWPSMVALIMKPPGKPARFFCGGTAIGSRWILTAAHCAAAMRADPAASYFVREGTQDLGSTESRDIQVVEIVVNDAYVPDRTLNDVALLKLKHPVSAPRQKLMPQSLITPMLSAGRTSTVIGFGLTTENGSVSRHLKEVDIPIIDQPACTQVYGADRITAANFCAGATDKDSCQGDSGGPLFLASNTGEQIQAGVVSWGKGCGAKGFYGVYASVGNFDAWIRQHVSDASFADASTRPAEAASNLTQGAASSSHPAGMAQVHIDIIEGKTFKVDSFIQVRVSSSVSGALVVFNENSDGTAYQLYPSKTFPGPDGSTEAAAIEAGKELRIPSPVQYDKGYRFQIQPPLGLNRLIAIVVPEKGKINRIIASHSDGGKIRDLALVISLIADEVDDDSSRGAVGGQITDRGSADVSYDIVN